MKYVNFLVSCVTAIIHKQTNKTLFPAINMLFSFHIFRITVEKRYLQTYRRSNVNQTHWWVSRRLRLSAFSHVLRSFPFLMKTSTLTRLRFFFRQFSFEPGVCVKYRMNSQSIHLNLFYVARELRNSWYMASS